MIVHHNICRMPLILRELQQSVMTDNESDSGRRIILIILVVRIQKFADRTLTLHNAHATVQQCNCCIMALLHCCTKHGLCSNSYQEYSNVNILNSIEPLRNALRSCFTNVMVTIYVLTNSRYPGEDGLHSKIEI